MNKKVLSPLSAIRSLSGKKARLSILLAAVLWGTTGTTQALAPEGASPLAIACLRMVIGGAALLALGLSKGSLGSFSSWPKRRSLLAGFAMASYQVCFFWGVSITGVAVGTMIAIGSGPIFSGLINFFASGQKPDRRWVAASAVAVLGMACLGLSGGVENLRADSRGVLLALGAGFSWALYASLNKSILAVKSPEATVAVLFSLAGLLLSPLLFFVPLGWIAQVSGALVVLHLGLVTTALCYSLFARGLTSCPANTAVTLTLAEPLTAALLGLVVLREPANALAVLGLVLMGFGLALLVFSPAERAEKAEAQNRLPG